MNTTRKMLSAFGAGALALSMLVSGSAYASSAADLKMQDDTEIIGPAIPIPENPEPGADPGPGIPEPESIPTQEADSEPGGELVFANAMPAETGGGLYAIYDDSTNEQKEAVMEKFKNEVAAYASKSNNFAQKYPSLYMIDQEVYLAENMEGTVAEKDARCYILDQQQIFYAAPNVIVALDCRRIITPQGLIPSMDSMRHATAPPGRRNKSVVVLKDQIVESDEDGDQEVLQWFRDAVREHYLEAVENKTERNPTLFYVDGDAFTSREMLDMNPKDDSTCYLLDQRGLFLDRLNVITPIDCGQIKVDYEAIRDLDDVTVADGVDGDLADRVIEEAKEIESEASEARKEREEYEHGLAYPTILLKDHNAPLLDTVSVASELHEDDGDCVVLDQEGLVGDPDQVVLLPCREVYEAKADQMGVSYEEEANGPSRSLLPMIMSLAGAFAIIVILMSYLFRRMMRDPQGE